MHQNSPSRRDVILASTALAGLPLANSLAVADDAKTVKDSKINQTIARWCFGRWSVEELAKQCVAVGARGIDLIGPADWPTLKKYDLVATMCPSHGIGRGLNRVENHDECLAKISEGIDACAQAGYPNVICFSGNRDGMDDAEGLRNCAIALKKIVKYAEDKKVTVCMELLNSKKDHGDYMCDRTHWGAELVSVVGSERFKLLYDIYHMQVQEGDVIATIQKHKDAIGHYHTAGVPGRNELDENQELNYPAVMRAIVATGFGGWVGQEFVPRRDPATSLKQAVDLCAV